MTDGSQGWGDETSPTPIDATIAPPRQPGEASRIAERWRDDAEQLAEGSQFLLAAATDIRNGVGLLRDEGGLTAITDLIEDLAIGGETLTQTYARVATATALFDQALSMGGLALIRTREQVVRLAVDIAEAAGGIDQASSLWSNYFNRFYTEAERIQFQLTAARRQGTTAATELGVNLDDYTGEGGTARFRTEFEAAMETATADAIVKWLKLAEVIGIVIDAEEALAATREANRKALDELLTGVRADEALVGLGDYERQLVETASHYDDIIEQARKLAATEAELAEIEGYRARALSDIAARAATDYDTLMGTIRNERAGGAGFAVARAEVMAWERQAIAQANSLARAAGLEGAAVSDLVDIHEVAADRVAALIEKLRGETLDIAVGLGYTKAPDTLDYLNRQIERLSATSTRSADDIGRAADQMRSQMQLLLSDLNPANDRTKLEIARGGLTDGTATREQFLQIAQRLFGQATDRYQQEFNYAMRVQVPVAGNGGAGRADSAQDTETRSLAELRQARELLLKEQRGDMADTLARRIAELSFASGDAAETIAQSMGWSLDQLAEDLSLDREALDAYLQTLTSQFEADSIGIAAVDITEAIQQSALDIIAAIRDGRAADLLGLNGAMPAPIGDKEDRPSAAKPALDPWQGRVIQPPTPASQDDTGARITGLERELVAVRTLLQQFLPQLAAASEAGVDAGERNVVESARVVDEVRRLNKPTPGGKRNTRVGAN